MEKKENRVHIVSAIAVVVLLYLVLEGFGITCPIKFLTGISCAGCGMSRAWIAVFHLDLARAFYFHWLPAVYTAIISFTNWLRKLILPAREMVSRLQDLLHLFYCHSLPAVFMLIIGTTNWEIV